MKAKGCLILIVFALIATGCGGKSETAATNSPSPSPTATESPRLPNAIDVDNRVFRPNSLTVAAGTTVTWTQISGYSHTVQSNTKLFNSHPNCQVKGDAPAFADSTKCMQKGDVFRFRFEKPGQYNYYCLMHSLFDANHPEVLPGGMSGTITVQ